MVIPWCRCKPFILLIWNVSQKQFRFPPFKSYIYLFCCKNYGLAVAVQSVIGPEWPRGLGSWFKLICTDPCSCLTLFHTIKVVLLASHSSYLFQGEYFQYSDFLKRAKLLTQSLIKHGYVPLPLKSSLQNFHNIHSLVGRYLLCFSVFLWICELTINKLFTFSARCC